MLLSSNFGTASFTVSDVDYIEDKLENPDSINPEKFAIHNFLSEQYGKITLLNE